jgi:uncharacterized protein (DUF58 family)
LRDRLIAAVTYTREFSEEGVYEGETVIMTETVTNPSFLPVFFLDVESYFYNGMRPESIVFEPRKAMQYFASRFHLWPYMQIKRRHTILCTERGYYQLETVDVFYSKRVRYIQAPASLYVYPKVVPVEEIPNPISSEQGDSITARRLIFDPFSVNGIRRYEFGDPFSAINFKATARSGILGIDGIRVNSRDYCSGRTVMVFLNYQLSSDKPIPGHIYDPMMERGLSHAAALIREAFYRGYRAGLACNASLMTGEDRIYYPIEGGDAHLTEILKDMAKVRSSVGISFHAMLSEPLKGDLTETEIFVLTPELTEEAAALLDQYSRQGNTVHVILLGGGVAHTDEELDS